MLAHKEEVALDDQQDEAGPGVDPEAVREVGADATALDGRQAALDALALPRQLKRH